MSAPLGYEALCELARELGRPQSTLTVLSHGADPFGMGTPAHIAHAEWFAALWRQHMPARGGHLRRLHYRLVVQPSPVPMVDSRPYENTVNCWSRLKEAGKWARYLGLLDADDFEDKRPMVRRLWMDLDEGTEVTAFVDEQHKELGKGFGWVYLSEPRLPKLPRWDLAGQTHRKARAREGRTLDSGETGCGGQGKAEAKAEAERRGRTMTEQRDNRLVKLCEMWQRKSAKGTIYFSGYMGDTQVLLFKEGKKPHPTRPDEEIIVWKLLVQERDPGRRPGVQTRNAVRGQRTWDRSRNATPEPPQSCLDDSAEAVRDLTDPGW